MIQRSLVLTIAVASGLACGAGTDAGKSAAASAPVVETEEQKTFYALGLALSNSLGQFGLTESELALVQAGITDGVLKRTPKLDLAEYRPKLNDLARARAEAAAEVEKKKGEEYAAKAAGEPGAQALPSGLVYKEIKAGAGEPPKPTDTVKVHYHGTLPDGTVFDSSVDRGEPAEFRLNGVIPCWTEGLQKMKPGGKSRLVCPAATAYGDRGAPPVIKPGATLTFEVELLEVKP